MSFRGGRDRQWKDYPLRPEEKSHHGRSTAPPSRHLWVGNLSHTLTERALSNHFREFGELESVAFSPGRSYAFVNFIEVSAAFAAFGALQGFVLAGNALRIEFTKAEKSSSSSTPSHDEDHDLYLHRRDEPRSSLRESPFPPQRDSRIRHSNSNSNPDNQKSKDDDEPNEVLWIGFPQSLKVDEHSFWNAFSPFGEIEKISSYPGRTYAFVRFKHVNSAIRAKDNLQGKLFGNPRVHITFARSETNSRPSNTGKNSNPDPVSPRYGRQHDRYHDERKRRFSPEGNRLTGRNHGFRDTGHDGYGRRSSSRDRNVNFHDFPPPRQPPMYDDEWDLPEDALIFHGAKKLKGGLIPPEPELPEYPFSDSGDLRNALHRPPGFDNNNNLGHFGFHNKQMIHDPPVNVSQPYHLERGNTHNIQNTRNTLGGPYDAFQGGPVSLAQNAIEWKRPTPEPHIPANEEWKWEGIIAKGGTSICRARCFPVGKVLDMILPEFLDCTARTSLDMLSKHYYQAASSWVVFFVPESDADMAFYNEFMNYLGEKQRAAVAKLDDKTTLFLVPPSDFSEKILKVPGKLSISGVILRLEQPSTTIDTLPLPPLPLPPAQRQHDPYLMMSHGESGRAPSGTFQPFQNVGKPRPGGSTMPFHVENTNTPEHLLHHQSSGGGGGGRLPPRSGGGGGGDFMVPNNQESGYRPGSPTVMPQYQEPKAVVTGGGIQPDQLAQLASFLGNSRQQQSVGEEFRQQNGGLVDNGYRTTTTTMTPHQRVSPSQHYHQAPPQPPSQQMSQYHQFQQMGQSSSGSQGNGQEETEADPQKRLQATLELAATLLKQIQQGKT